MIELLVATEFDLLLGTWFLDGVLGKLDNSGVLGKLDETGCLDKLDASWESELSEFFSKVKRSALLLTFELEQEFFEADILDAGEFVRLEYLSVLVSFKKSLSDTILTWVTVRGLSPETRVFQP